MYTNSLNLFKRFLNSAVLAITFFGFFFTQSHADDPRDKDPRYIVCKNVFDGELYGERDYPILLNMRSLMLDTLNPEFFRGGRQVLVTWNLTENSCHFTGSNGGSIEELDRPMSPEFREFLEMTQSEFDTLVQQEAGKVG
jgi:hypothetical protein